MRTPSHRRVLPSFRPHVLSLEARLPLGDGLLGLLVSGALLRAHTAPAAQTSPATGEPGASATRVGVSGADAFLRSLTLPARQTEGAFTAPFGDNLAAPDWGFSAGAFAPRVRPHSGGAHSSPQREHGLDAAPLLAPRVGEKHGTAHVFAAPMSHADADLLATLAALYQPEAPARAAEATPAQEAQVKENFGKLPLYFEQNVGQTDASVQFFTHGPGYGLYLTSTEAVMVLRQPITGRAGDVSPLVQDAALDGMPHRGADAPRSPEAPPAVVRMQFVGANATPVVTGLEQQPGKINYFLGNDPDNWHTNIATFGRVEYADVYPGIDLVYYGTDRQLEYDFVVSPGADPSVIRLNVSGAERLELDAAGDLLVHVGEPGGAGEPGGVSPGVTLRQHAPFVYQTVGSARQEVTSRFVPEGQQVRFAVGAYDAARPLVIDPVLSYSTYLGGSASDDGLGLAVDRAGNAFLTGYTDSTNFPTANPFQQSLGGLYDVFVTRLNAAGTGIVYSTYLGGSNADRGLSIAVDPSTGDALITGETNSTNFPTVNPVQSTCNGCPTWRDAFVTRLRANGASLLYSTFLGGSNIDSSYGIAMDLSTGDALITGETRSTDFPTANAVQPTNRGEQDAFVTRLNMVGTALVYSTYLGGTNTDFGQGIAVNPNTGDAFVTGFTNSANFPTANAFQAANRGQTDAFVTRLSRVGTTVIYSTYLGGSFGENGTAIAVNPSNGNAFVTGYTQSTDFPTRFAYQSTNHGIPDAFVTQLNAAGTSLAYSTYLGGSSGEFSNGIAVDPTTGRAIVTGYTSSLNFPVVDGIQLTNRGGADVFVTRLNAVGAGLLFSTYLGGSEADVAAGIALSPSTGDVFVMGSTGSTNFPTANPLQPLNRGSNDAFVTKIVQTPPCISLLQCLLTKG